MGPRKKKWAYLDSEKERGVEAQTASATQRYNGPLQRGKKGRSEEDKVKDPELLLVAGTTEAA